MNHQIRCVLSTHQVDLAVLQFSAFGKTVRLSGYLRRSNGHEFQRQIVDEMVKNLLAIPGIRSIKSDLDNWIIETDNVGRRGHQDLNKLSKDETQRILDAAQNSIIDTKKSS